MADWYSDHFTDGLSATDLEASGLGLKPAVGAHFASAKTGYLTRWVKRPRVVIPIGGDGVAGDTVRIANFLSGDRIYDIIALTDGSMITGWVGDLGIYEAGDEAGLGPVIKDDLFAEGLDLDAASLRAVDEVAYGGAWLTGGAAGGGPLTDERRGLALWELVNTITADTYARDPQEQWTLVFTLTGSPAAQIGDGQVIFEIDGAGNL